LPCTPLNLPPTSTADVPVPPAVIRPYACTLSPVIDLVELPGGDLADKMQHALARIVSELHLIGGWTSDYARQLNESRQHAIREWQSSTSSPESFATHSDLERLRREVARELRSEITKSKTTAFTSATATKEAESASVGAQIVELERSMAQLHATHQSELAALSRRTETGTTTLTLQVADVRRDAHDIRLEAREAHDQVAAALRVLRLEVREQHEQTQRRLQQLVRKVGTFNPPGKSPACSPRSASAAPLSSIPVGAGVMLQTGASTITAPDCFVYAKASLPPHRSNTVVHETPKTASASSPVIKRVWTPSKTHVRATDIDTGVALQVKSAVLQIPLGYGEDEEEDEEDSEDGMLDEVDESMEDHRRPIESHHKGSEASHPPQTNGRSDVRASSISAASVPSPAPRFHSSRLHSLPAVATSSAIGSPRNPSFSSSTTSPAVQSKSNAHVNVTPKPPAPR
jgi:hypothetical protein